MHLQGLFNAPSLLISAANAATSALGSQRRLQDGGYFALPRAGTRASGGLTVDATSLSVSGWSDPAVVAGVAAVAQATHEHLAAAMRSYGRDEASGPFGALTGTFDVLRGLSTEQLESIGGGRRLATAPASSAAASISSPITCLTLGQTVVWDLPGGRGAYPVYVKDSFLNSNPSFDYGAFRTLASLAMSSTSST